MNSYEQTGQNTKGKLPVIFKYEDIKNEEKSHNENRPVFDHVPMAYIHVGNKDIVARRIKKNKDGEYSDPVIDENPNSWKAFIGQFKEEVFDGTALSQWPHPEMTAERVAAYRSINIKTVEHLAGVTDSGLIKLGKDARLIRDAAISYLSNAKDGVGLLKAQSQIDELKAQNELLQSQVQSLMPKKNPVDKKTKTKEQGD